MHRSISICEYTGMNIQGCTLARAMHGEHCQRIPCGTVDFGNRPFGSSGGMQIVKRIW
jgi:hypothetical protein